MREKNTQTIGLFLLALVLSSTIIICSAPPQKRDIDYIHATLKKDDPDDYAKFGWYYCNSIRVTITDTDPEGCVTRVWIRQVGRTLYDGNLTEGSSTGYISTGGYATEVWLIYAYGQGNPTVYDSWGTVEMIT